MRMSVEKKVSELNGIQKKLSLWYRLVLVLACVVVIITTYALIVPAMTMEGDYICGKTAHVHTDDCKGEDEDGNEVYTCGMEEHIHDERCLVHTETADSPYDCGHDYEHTHDSECYVGGKLVCTMEEHTHTNGCLKQAPARAGAQAEDPTEEPTEQEVTQAVTEPPAAGRVEDVTQPTEEDLTEAPTAAPTEPAATEQQTEEDTEQPTEPATDEQPTEDPTEPATGEQPTDDPTEPATGEPSTDDPTEPSTEAPTEPETVTELPDVEVTEQLTGDAMLADPDGVELMDPKTILDTATLMELNGKITLDIYKKVYGPGGSVTNVEVDEDIISGGDYYFSLNIKNVSMANYNTGGLNLIYYYDLVLPEQLKAPALETKFREHFDVLTSDVKMYFKEKGNGIRIFFMVVNRPVISVTLEGSAMGVGDENDIDISVDKTAEFDPAELAYRYSIQTPIPAAVDNYSATYSMTDASTVTGATFNPFVENEITVEYRFEDETEFHTMPLLDDVTDEDDLAYRLEDGTIRFFNRIPEDKQKYLIETDETIKVGTEWFNNWAQKKNVYIKVSYLDTYTRDHQDVVEYGSRHFKGQITNVAYLNGISGSTTKSLDGLLNKAQNRMAGEGEGNQFTITVNEARHDFGSQAFVVKDTMTNCCLKIPETGEAITIWRVNTNGSRTLLTGGKTIRTYPNEDGKITSFEVEIENPGSSTYEIVYDVDKLNPEDNGEFSNIATLNDSSIKDVVRSTFKADYINYDALSIAFQISFTKEYEEYSPRHGATFTLYQVMNGMEIPVLESYTRAAGGSGSTAHNERVVAIVNDSETEPYVMGAYIPGDPSSSEPVNSETITFDSKHFYLVPDTLYVIRETEAPEGYDKLDDSIYFYFYFDEENHFDRIPEDIRDRTDIIFVRNFDDWEVRTDDDGQQYLYAEKDTGVNWVNTLTPYELPETGGTGVLKPAVCGIGLLAFTGMMSTRDPKRRRDRRAKQTKR